jgi:hypothetical protein
LFRRPAAERYVSVERHLKKPFRGVETHKKASSSGEPRSSRSGAGPLRTTIRDDLRNLVVHGRRWRPSPVVRFTAKMSFNRRWSRLNVDPAVGKGASFRSSYDAIHRRCVRSGSATLAGPCDRRGDENLARRGRPRALAVGSIALTPRIGAGRRYKRR